MKHSKWEHSKEDKRIDKVVKEDSAMENRTKMKKRMGKKYGK